MSGRFAPWQLVVLWELPGVGPKRLYRILSALESNRISPVALLRLPLKVLVEQFGVPRATAAWIGRNQSALMHRALALWNELMTFVSMNNRKRFAPITLSAKEPVS